jgi:hypothetical protein
MAAVLPSFRTMLIAAGLTASLTGAQAITLTIPTSLIDAEAQFNFSSVSSRLMDNMGIGVSALGNTRAVAGSPWSFMMPVTKVSLDASLFGWRLDPVSGQASGSGLLIQSEYGALSLANFGLDFNRNVLTADLATSAGIMKNFDVYSFRVDSGLHVSTTGGLSMKMNLADMMLTSSAQGQFASALQLEPYAVAVLSKVNFGSLAIDIAPGLRFNVSDKPLIAPVPESSTLMMLTAGMLGIAFVARRKMAA